MFSHHMEKEVLRIWGKVMLHNYKYAYFINISNFDEVLEFYNC